MRGQAGALRIQTIWRDQRVIEIVRTVADRHAATPAQVALAWTLAQGEHVTRHEEIALPHRQR